VTGLERDPLTDTVIGLAIEVHRQLGPGLLESVYEECLCHELTLAEVEHQRQVVLPLAYKGVNLGSGFRLDIVVENRLVVEVKATEKLLPIHEAQLLSYLRLSRRPVGLLLNFNEPVLRQGLRRMMLK
jgi:GxxExxY protein